MELREKIRQVAIDNEAYVLAKSVGIDAIIDAVLSEMHDSIMRHELNWPDTREDAWLNATIHRWIDTTLETAKEQTK